MDFFFFLINLKYFKQVLQYFGYLNTIINIKYKKYFFASISLIFENYLELQFLLTQFFFFPNELKIFISIFYYYRNMMNLNCFSFNMRNKKIFWITCKYCNSFSATYSSLFSRIVWLYFTLFCLYRFIIHMWGTNRFTSRESDSDGSKKKRCRIRVCDSIYEERVTL